MGDWIDDEAESIASQDDEIEQQRRRQEQLGRSAQDFWRRLTHAVKADVDKINRNERIMSMVCGELTFLETSVGSFMVDKNVFPHITVEVTLRNNHIEIKRTTVELLNAKTVRRDGDYKTRTSKLSEKLEMLADATRGFYLRNKDHQIIEPETVSQYLIRPILVPPNR
jgi:hypothetical protein